MTDRNLPIQGAACQAIPRHRMRIEANAHATTASELTPRFWLTIAAVLGLVLVPIFHLWTYAAERKPGPTVSRPAPTVDQSDDADTTSDPISAALDSPASPVGEAELRATIEKCNERLREVPSDGYALFLRGWALCRQGNFEQAIIDLDQAIVLDYDDPQLLVERGYASQMLGDHQRAADYYTRAIVAKPNDGETLLRRAYEWSQLGKWEKALSDLDRVIELEPKSSSHRAARGMAHFERRDYDKATTDFLDAIHLNPGDLGIDYQPTSGKVLSHEALEHGERQVRQMLHDRPAMAEHVTEGDEVWTWAVRKFAGEDYGSLIDWNSASPRPFSGCSLGAADGQHAWIRVGETESGQQDNPRLSFERLWSVAVFELYNILAFVEWSDVHRLIDAGQFSREQFIRGMIKREELSIQRTRAFYLSVFLPSLHRKNFDITSPRNWFCDEFAGIDESAAVETYWRNAPHWKAYGVYYDFYVAHREYRRGNYDQARAIALSVLADPSFVADERLAEAHQLLGYISRDKIDLKNAIDEFTAALAVFPGDSESLLQRGVIRVKAGSIAEAIDDLTRVLDDANHAASAFMWRGCAYAAQKKYDRALADFNEAIALAPQDAENYNQRGYVWLDKQDFVRAVADFSESLRITPEDALTLRNRAFALQSRGEYHEALRDLNAALQLDLKDSQVYLERGNAHFMAKHYQAAWNDFSTAIQLDPKQAEYYGRRANLAIMSDDPNYRRPAAAVQDARRSCELTDWKSAPEINLLAAAYAASGDFDMALRWQTKALQLCDATLKPTYDSELAYYRSQQQSAPKKPACSSGHKRIARFLKCRVATRLRSCLDL